MEIQFCGAAQTVTGSQHLLKINGKRILLDCGLFQGRRSEFYERNQNFPFPAASLDAVVLSHAHIDHSGNLPTLVKKGFQGKIFSTPATGDLCTIMLHDSAFIQEHDAEWINKIRRKKNEPPITPLYTVAEAREAMHHFVPFDYGKTFTVVPGVEATFFDSGHILGSAGVVLQIKDKGRTLRLGFSGDVGRPDMPILNDPVPLSDLDALIMESTYGSRHHTLSENAEEELAQTVRETSAGGGKIIIPAFAVGRTQLIVYMLHKLFDAKKIPEIPIFVDSPLASEATEVFRHHFNLLDGEAERLFLKKHEDPFGFRRLKYIKEAAESKALNGMVLPHVIISASGMAEGGRVVHHLHNNIQKHNNLVLFVGFAAKETLARKIMDGQRTVKIFGEEHEVRCKIKIMDTFSAHADRAGLLKFARTTPPEKLKHIFLVHGEPDQAVSLRDALRSGGYENVAFPALNETLTV